MFLPCLTLALVTCERIDALEDLAPTIFLEYPATAAASTDREFVRQVYEGLLHVSHPRSSWSRDLSSSLALEEKHESPCCVSVHWNHLVTMLLPVVSVCQSPHVSVSLSP